MERDEGGKVPRRQNRRALKACIRKSAPFPKTNGELLTDAKEGNGMIISCILERALWFTSVSY